MKLLNERMQLSEVAEKWHRQYADDIANRRFQLFDAKAIYQQLKALDTETATAADVAKIIGNDSWICPTECCECHERSWDVFEMGGNEDHPRTFYICVMCLHVALRMFGTLMRKTTE